MLAAVLTPPAAAAAAEFCALLEHLDIRLLEDKRRKLFARIDKSADGTIGYQEFQVRLGRGGPGPR
jgi:Ca2+-binding EF-hand superfamily protein